LGFVSLSLVGCDTVDPETAAKSVADVVFSHTGFRPKDVMCPSGIDAKVGTKFDCGFTGLDGKPVIAHMKITKVGDHVEFDVVLPEG
jgi:hypothetical protein